ncbi:ATP-binding cassette sub-family B member 8, mitochondrial [Bagarius yarrelli]|uniref:ATP-binding cassette sub-family B member 8, mitochondrial n=1 Tax=Bagarius yarrelli TaxID=175774 RepID=A0A556U1I6_BAGYA|nr:ATP-binding cassette sub-family B member 8, mitochondrial [Bagarius yarrelli]
MFHILRCSRLTQSSDRLLRYNVAKSRDLLLHSNRYGQRSRQWTTCQYSTQHSTNSTVIRIWTRAQKALRLGTQRCLKSPGVALTFVVGPAALTLTARLFGTVAHCSADFNNNNLPEKAQPTEKIPEFSWALLWEFVRPQILALFGAVVLAFGAAALNIQIPLMLGDLVNVVARYMREHVGNYMRDIRAPALKLLGLYGLQGLLTTGYIVLLSRVGESVAAEMRKSLFASLLRQDVAFFDANKTGQLVNRLTADIQEFKSSFKLVISQGLRSVTQTVGCFVSLYVISPKLTGLMVVVLPCLVGAGALIGSFLRKLSRKAQEQVSKATGVADEALGNVRTVRAFAMEDRELETYAREVEKSAMMNEALGRGIAVFQGLSNIVLNCLVLGTIFAGGSLMAHNDMTPGDLMSFLVASQTVQRSLASISILFGQASDTVFNTNGQGYERRSPRFRVHDLGTYHFPEGRGTDSTRVSEGKGRLLERRLQEPVLFGTSVMENIRFGKPSATDDEVMSAAKQANAHNFITNFPDGYDTVVGERGVTLSGGQKQRIAIARALVKNPSVLILDEATSALDAESERVVQEALDRATEGRTVLIIAHRLSTIQGADLICVMSRGKVVEAGTHLELLKKGGLYAELIKRQRANDQKH